MVGNILDKVFNLITKKPFLFLISLGLLLLISDAFFYRAMISYNVPKKIIDIQTPSTLYCKLDYLNKFQGKKIVLIGDSVIYGRAMLEDGDKEWHEHTISAYLEREFSKHWRDEPVLILNLGMNGALPTDIEQCIKLLKPIKIDILILDITLRSFSNDFSSEETLFSRPWLKQLSFDQNGKYNYSIVRNDFFSIIENTMQNFLVNNSALYRYRDYLQWLFFNAEPAHAIKSWRDQLNKRLQNLPSIDEDPLILALKAKNRYSSVNFSKDNPQRNAFERLLRSLNERKQKTIVFYAKEDSEKIYNIIDQDQHESLLSDLRTLIESVSSQDILYIPSLVDLSIEHYVDYVHLNKEGYRLLAEGLYSLIAPILD